MNFRQDAWQTRALKALTQLTIEKPYLTSDELHDVIEDPGNPNAMGAVFNAAQQLGLIIDTDRMVHSTRSEAKKRKITLWQSCYHRNPNYLDPDPVSEYLKQTGQASQQASIF